MEVADLDFRRLIAQAGSVESNECEGPNQKAEQIKPPMRYQDISTSPIAPPHRMAFIPFARPGYSNYRLAQAMQSRFGGTSNCVAGRFTTAVRKRGVDSMEHDAC